MQSDSLARRPCGWAAPDAVRSCTSRTIRRDGRICGNRGSPRSGRPNIARGKLGGVATQRSPGSTSPRCAGRAGKATSTPAVDRGRVRPRPVSHRRRHARHTAAVCGLGNTPGCWRARDSTAARHGPSSQGLRGRTRPARRPGLLSVAPYGAVGIFPTLAWRLCLRLSSLFLVDLFQRRPLRTRITWAIILAVSRRLNNAQGAQFTAIRRTIPLRRTT